MNPIITQIYQIIEAKKNKLPKYDPRYHSNKKISERDLNSILVDILISKELEIEPSQWYDITCEIYKIFLNKDLAKQEAEPLFSPEQKSRMLKEASILKLHDPIDNDEPMREIIMPKSEKDEFKDELYDSSNIKMKPKPSTENLGWGKNR